MRGVVGVSWDHTSQRSSPSSLTAARQGGGTGGALSDMPQSCSLPHCVPPAQLSGHSKISKRVLAKDGNDFNNVFVTQKLHSHRFLWGQNDTTYLVKSKL